MLIAIVNIQGWEAAITSCKSEGASSRQNRIHDSVLPVVVRGDSGLICAQSGPSSGPAAAIQQQACETPPSSIARAPQVSSSPVVASLQGRAQCSGLSRKRPFSDISWTSQPKSHKPAAEAAGHSPSAPQLTSSSGIKKRGFWSRVTGSLLLWKLWTFMNPF